MRCCAEVPGGDRPLGRQEASRRAAELESIAVLSLVFVWTIEEPAQSERLSSHR